MFVTILAFACPNDPASLFENFREDLCEDFAYALRDRNPEERQLKDLALTVINDALLAMNKSLDLFPGVPKPSVQVALDEILANEPVRGPSPESLNSDQRSALDKILQIIQSRTGQSFFVDGPGGKGKLICTVQYYVQQLKKDGYQRCVLGIAPLLLPNGRTALVPSTWKLLTQSFFGKLILWFGTRTQ